MFHTPKIIITINLKMSIDKAKVPYIAPKQRQYYGTLINIWFVSQSRESRYNIFALKVSHYKRLKTKVLLTFIFIITSF